MPFHWTSLLKIKREKYKISVHSFMYKPRLEYFTQFPLAQFKSIDIIKFHDHLIITVLTVSNGGFKKSKWQKNHENLNSETHIH